MTATQIVRESASFRDPDGFVFQYRKEWYRFVALVYQEHYDHFLNSGLYERLIQDRFLLPHQEVSAEHFSFPAPFYKILKPSQLEFVLYPYEWCFSQLKEAAIATLKIQKIAHQFGMCLKDASAFNIQFYQGKPTLIDTLSFHRCAQNAPWIAMGQFYRHFLWPLLAMANIDVTLNKLFLLYPDGFKYELLKPWFGIKTWFKPSILLHIHLHGMLANKVATNPTTKQNFQLPASYLQILIERMIALIEKLNVKQKSVWKDYYHNTNYEQDSFQEKETYVLSFIQRNRGKALIDFGANNGHFSVLAQNICKPIFALDFDALALDALYNRLDVEARRSIIPCWIDLTNPSPSIGWQNTERTALLQRLPQNAAALVLALTHHLHITHNIHFDMQAVFFASYCENLLIEFIPLDDSQCVRLLNNRYDTPHNYSIKDFEVAFTQYFTLCEKHSIPGTKRTLYHFRRKLEETVCD